MWMCVVLYPEFFLPQTLSILSISLLRQDVGALCVAHALAEQGEAEILAIVMDTALPEGPGAVSAINSYYGRSDIPIGAYRGHIGNPSHTPGPAWTNKAKGWYAEKLVERFKPPIRDASQVEDAVTLLRRTLAAAPEDRSITIVAVGHVCPRTAIYMHRTYDSVLLPALTCALDLLARRPRISCCCFALAAMSSRH